MSRYEGLKYYQNSRPEEKLAVLQSEMVPLISAVRGYAAILKQWVESQDHEEMPEDVRRWIDNIIEAGDSLQELREWLTGNSE